MTLNRKWFGIAGGFFALTFLVYAGSLGNGFFILDDGLLIYENNAVREISPYTLKTVFTSYDPELYIPLTFLSYQIDYLIGGYSPFIYHFTNLLLHTLNALLVTWFVYLLLQRKWIALVCGILFAIHPLHAEAVVWASARKDVLSTFFFLGALVAYLHGWERRRGEEGERKSLLATFFSSPLLIPLLLFALGLLAKVTVLTLPIILLLIDYLQKRQWSLRIITEKLPYFALSLLFGIIALGGKADAPDPTILFQKFLLASKSTLFYLQKIFLPFNLTVFYPQLTPIQITSPEFFVPLLLLFLLLLFLLILSLRFSSKKPLARIAVFSLLFFVITLAPSFLTISKGGNIFFASDRYAYIPSIGIFLIVSSLFSSWLQRSPRGHFGPFGPLGIIGTLLVALTLRQSLLWGDSTAFFTHTTRIYPNFYLPYISLGASYRKEKQYKEALEAYRTAISLRELPNTYGLIGQVYAEDGKYKEAITEFEHALLLAPDDPELHYGIGQVQALQGNTEAAFASYERSLKLRSDDQNDFQALSRRISVRRDRVYYRMGLLYGESGQHNRSVEYLQKAIGENPSFADAHYNLAVGLGQLRKLDEAIEHYKRTIELNPAHVKARVNLGLLHMNGGKRKEAKEQFEKVLRIDAGNTIARNALDRL